MKTFEIHITGEESIIKEFDELGIKNIEVELLSPTLQVLRTEYMCSLVSKHKNFKQCKIFVFDLISKLKSKIIRVKIESPFYDEYQDQALYIECHFKTEKNWLPLSRNKKSGKIMATDRNYDNFSFGNFIQTYEAPGVEIELCLYDDYIREDFDWFKLYEL